MGLVVGEVQMLDRSNLMKDLQTEEDEAFVVEVDVERCNSSMVLVVGKGIEMDGMVELD